MNDHNSQPSPLNENTFPRTCPRCQTLFSDEADFFARTSAIPHAGSDVRVIRDDDDVLRSMHAPVAVYLEVYRNCACGTTLMERFHSRRDMSENGLRRRQAFGEMLGMLEKTGCGRDEARHKLLDFIEHVTR